MYHDIRMTARKIASRLLLIEPLVYRRKHPLTPLLFKALSGPTEPPPLDVDGDDTAWRAIPPGTYWGGRDINFVMCGEFSVPGDFDRESDIALSLPLGDAGDFAHPEALAYIDGTAYATTDRFHQEFRLAPAHLDGKPHRLLLHGWTGLMGEAFVVETQRQLYMQECAVVQIDGPTRAFIAAARTALQAATLLNDVEPAKTRLYNALDAAFLALDTREPLGNAFYESAPGALEVLRKGIAVAGSPLDAEIIAAGHAHIDVAWLWTLGQTRRKAGRTFYTAIRLMEQFPDFRFTQSQPQLYDFVSRDYPELFRAIKERVAEGRWEPVGGMWVEADCNISGPESLARQFLLGRSFFRRHFGKDVESPVLWLPDVFGYAWSLPQLIRLAGMEYFFTIKIGWNQYNRMPNDSFWWQGLDGTKVLTHFSTTPDEPWSDDPNAANYSTYNANLSALAAHGTWAKLKHKDSQRTMLMSYGYGDGGGGPTREMNENALELREFPALPVVRQGRVIDFFRKLDAESGSRLPTWNSELYLEIHRGTYTTQSRSKRANRKSEFLLHDAEFLAALASVLDPGYSYPHDDFSRAWELVCLNQFHDIIPGSSIGAVYEESLRQYEEVRALAEEARDGALSVVKDKVGGDVLLVNPTGFRRDDLAFWPGELPEGQRLKGEVYTQPVDGGTLVRVPEIDPLSVRGLSFEQGEPHRPDPSLFPLTASPSLLENAYLRAELNEDGDIVRIYDKRADREVLPAGAVANQFQAFEDRPVNWDAWDIDIFYDDKMFLAEPADSIRVVESGPLRATLEIKRRILNSSYTQRLSLAYDSAQLWFDTQIDWRERHILLKVAFPVDILSPVATYEIQWGSVQRPTHRNTSWDWARFETCAQKWVDLSEGGYGVALLNDCKYGHDIRDKVIRLSLLRSPTQPDPEADQGTHRFVYSLVPHANAQAASAANSQITQLAYALNDPIIAVSGSGRAGSERIEPFISLPRTVVMETVKLAEDGEGIIARFYECDRTRGKIHLRTGFPIKEACITNLLEENQQRLDADRQSLELNVRPFQILTVRLVPA